MLSYEKRATLCHNPTAAKLLNIMVKKKTNLAASVDVISKTDLLSFADLLGPQICILKTHIDILEDFDATVTRQLLELAKKHQFLIFEDRKFADIGNTVKLQYEKGIYRIAQWASITNAHPLPGPGIIEGLKEVGQPLGNALLLLAQMSSEGNLMDQRYIDQTVQMALAYKAFVIGFITQHKLLEDPGFIHMTPGVQLDRGQDALGQCYITPRTAIYEKQNDIIIVGRGIYKNADPLAAAHEYRTQGWQAYLERISKNDFACE